MIAELVQNPELARVHSRRQRMILQLSGAHHPHGSAPAALRHSYRGAHAKAREGVQQILDWAPERCVLAHGRWYDQKADAELRRAFGWLGPFDERPIWAREDALPVAAPPTLNVVRLTPSPRAHTNGR